MLNRAANTSLWAPVRRELLDGPISALLRYALLLLVLCLVGCLYLLQTNELARLNERTLSLEAKTTQLETQNLTLKIQLAQWNSPGHVRSEALKQNYVRNPDVLYVNTSGATNATAGLPAPVGQTAEAR